MKDLIKRGAYILKSIDQRRGYTGYEVVIDVSETEREIHFELNRSAYLICKNKLGMKVVVRQVSFLNDIPFACRCESREPMKEFYI